ncbi:MAG: N-acetylglucosamine-6-phosphate deacetylase [Subtercola sp.]|nr:N-acetylglucosamine-6-phosphate deacetylase [Subtercola sp.]
MAVTWSGREPATGDVLEVSAVGGIIVGIRRFPHRLTNDLPWLTPGLIDLQVNGYRGFDVNAEELSVETLMGLRESLLEGGVTTFVPTVITNSRERISFALQTISDARSREPVLSRAIPFVHLEGPYISAEEGPRGCHDEAWIRPPDLDEFTSWQKLSSNLIGMITVSPHWPQSAKFIAAARRLGVRVAVGHTHAAPAEIRAAVDAGASYSTHLGNGAHALIVRHPNYLWTQLADSRLTAGFISDGHHLSKDAFAVMLRAKGIGGSFLVSDSAALAGMPPGNYHAAVGGDVEVTDDGRLVSLGTPYLAGAAASLSDGVARAPGLASITLADSVALATVNPGRVIDAIEPPGQLRIGASSDLMTFRWQPGDTELHDIQCEAAAR